MESVEDESQVELKFKFGAITETPFIFLGVNVSDTRRIHFQNMSNETLIPVLSIPN